ncbi:hypothetical protein C6503_05685 [Candidatus Poribacteria bacterium]|nr:MAG: hypothetical protein C6503_05685 [Candidatus Poribacteria bacterium]
MRGNEKKILISVLVVMVLWFPTVQAEQAETVLRWKNGDVLPGQLQESNSETIRWASPYFLDDLVLDINVLDSVAFPKTSNPVTEAFRVSTVSGDVWIADLIGSDNDTFLFSSKRHDQFRVKRSVVWSLERRNPFNHLFDGSELTNWKSFKSKRDIPLLLVFDEHEPVHVWHRDNEGHPKTSQNKAELFHALKWPKSFEIDLALAFTEHPPSFVFAFGKNLYQALRLEVWSDKLVAVQGTLFQPVLTIQPEQRDLRLRLTYDESAGVLRAFDFIGNLLLELEGIKPTVQESGPYIQNQGKGLTVQALKVFHRPVSEPTLQQIDFSKPHVYMMNGQIVQGELFVQKDSVYIRDADGTRRDIDLQQISRVIQPGTPPTALDQPTTLEYPDEVVLHGKIIAVNSERVILQTTFADEPVTGALAGASLLRFDTNRKTDPTVEKNKDRLFHATGNIRGRVLFSENRDTSSIQWKSIGALKPVRLTHNQATRIERSLKSTSAASHHFDTAQFPHTLHLQSGEIIPCQIIASDGTTLSFQSPVMSVQRMDLASIKALEFSDRTHAISRNEKRPKDDNRSVRISVAGLENELKDGKIQRIVLQADDTKFVIDGNNIELKDGMIVLMRNEGGVKKQPAPDWVEIVPNFSPVTPRRSKENDKMDVKLERALTVPRFSRDTPPHHILMANNGDMKRGKLLSFNGQTIQFDSKLQRFAVPMDRVARVVNVSKPEIPPDKSVLPDDAFKEKICVKLTDGSILIFDPLEVRDDKLLGRSPIYGTVSVPIESVKSLYFGEKAKFFKDAFAKWIIRPAKKPTYNH